MVILAALGPTTLNADGFVPVPGGQDPLSPWILSASDTSGQSDTDQDAGECIDWDVVFGLECGQDYSEIDDGTGTEPPEDAKPDPDEGGDTDGGDTGLDDGGDSGLEVTPDHPMEIIGFPEGVDSIGDGADGVPIIFLPGWDTPSEADQQEMAAAALEAASISLAILSKFEVGDTLTVAREVSRDNRKLEKPLAARLRVKRKVVVEGKSGKVYHVLMERAPAFGLPLATFDFAVFEKTIRFVRHGKPVRIK